MKQTPISAHQLVQMKQLGLVPADYDSGEITLDELIEFARERFPWLPVLGLFFRIVGTALTAWSIIDAYKTGTGSCTTVDGSATAGGFMPGEVVEITIYGTYDADNGPIGPPMQFRGAADESGIVYIKFTYTVCRD